MKTKLFAIAAFACSFIGVSQSIYAETNFVDTIANQLKGVWYKVYRVSGYTGHKYTVYDSDSTVTSQIHGTDSILWKDYEKGIVKTTVSYAITYGKSYLTNEISWKLKDELLFAIIKDTLQLKQDFPDGSMWGYARSKVPTSIEYPTQRGNILFAQPTNNHVSVQGLSSIDRLEIRDLFGRIQRQLDRIDVGEPIDISSLSPGIYLVKVYSGKETYAGKVIRR